MKFIFCKIFILSAVFFVLPAFADSGPNGHAVGYWNKARIDKAAPRDLFVDERGYGYLKKPDGTFKPYGHTLGQLKSSTSIKPNARPSGGGGNESNPPVISDLSPEDGQTITDAHSFTAVVTDDSGVRSVSFVITYPNGSTTQSFAASLVGNDVYQANLSGFTDGNWSWQVVAKDTTKKGGNTGTSASFDFVVDTGGGSGGDGGDSDTVTNSHWQTGGAVASAAGRIYFEMPSDKRHRRAWGAYVCSGTVAEDATTGRSIIITAAHCVYDDQYKAFARNVIFIPNQDQTSGTGTDLDCSNDPIGCWSVGFGVVDVDWATRKFPDNIEWDYAYYVVSDTGAHSGSAASSDALDVATGALAVDFTTPYFDDTVPGAETLDFTYGLGYSYNDDPNFMYCAEDMTTEGSVNWWLASCGLSGGSSGGPWIQNMDLTTGSGSIMSVNSWSYTTSSGMAGPQLVGTSAECLLVEAKGVSFSSIEMTDGEEGLVVDYCP